MKMQFLEIYVSYFTVSPSPKSVNQAPANGSLPSVPVRPANTFTPTPPTSERPVKTVVPRRQINLFSIKPVRLESQKTKVTEAAHTHTTAGQDRITPAKVEQQTAKPCKPYEMRFSLEHRAGAKARVLRIPTSGENSERYPKAKHVVNRLPSSKRRGELQNSSYKPNLRGGVRNISAPSSQEKRHVRFQLDTRQT